MEDSHQLGSQTGFVPIGMIALNSIESGNKIHDCQVRQAVKKATLNNLLSNENIEQVPGQADSDDW